MTNEKVIQKELDALHEKYPDWDFSATFNGKVSDTKQVNVKSVIKKIMSDLAALYPKYKFTFCRETYSAIAIVKITALNKHDNFAYYKDNNVGYIVYNKYYQLLIDEFSNNIRNEGLPVRVRDFVENDKTMLLEFHY